jgi:methionyl aminopeptidase
MKIKKNKEIAKMRAAGLLLWETHQVAKELVKAGTTTREIDVAIEKFVLSNGGKLVFKNMPAIVPFPGAACFSVNEELIHGIPADRELVEGDILSIDIGIKLNSWCADAAVTWPVGEISEEKQRLLDVTEDTLRSAIEALGQKRQWSQISRQMEAQVENAGFSVVKEYVGHGIGKSLWEEPRVPNYHDRSYDFPLVKGLVLAIEPMVNMGSEEVVLREDHWTIATQDGSPCAHFEHTVAITEKGPMVLTCGPNGEGWAM